MTDVLVNRFARAAPSLNVPEKKESSRDTATCARLGLTLLPAAAAASEIVKNGYGAAAAAIHYDATASRECIARFAAAIVSLSLSLSCEFIANVRERERSDLSGRTSTTDERTDNRARF